MDLDLHLDLDLELGWIWGDSGMDLGWIWDPALARFSSGFRGTGARGTDDGSRAVTPSGHILDPFLTSIRTL